MQNRHLKIFGQKGVDILDKSSHKKCMTTETAHPKWEQIEAIALRLGVKKDTIRKWAERGGVPGKWQVPIIVQSKGRVSIKDFAERAD